jgi:zinc and cadmium transporter
MIPSTLYTIIATSLISLVSLIGIFTLSLSERGLHRILNFLLAYSAGTILGAALFDLMPEAIELVDEHIVFPIIAFGFVFFLFLERGLYWYHGHGHSHEFPIDGHEENDIGEVTKSFAYLNVIGDFVHNFIDGMIIAASFINGVTIGVAASIAVAFHELPQEMGDYGILIYAGIERRRALLYNFIAALSIVVGGVFGSFFIVMVEELSGWMIAFSAGAFLFLSASELIPEIHDDNDWKKSLVYIFFLLLGMFTIFSLGFIFPHE